MSRMSKTKQTATRKPPHISIETYNEDGSVLDSLYLDVGGAIVITFDEKTGLLSGANAVGDISLEGFGIGIGKLLHRGGYSRKILKDFKVLISNTMYEIEKYEEQQREEPKFKATDEAMNTTEDEVKTIG